MAGSFENFFCCSSTQAVQDDSTAYTFPELPSSTYCKEQLQQEEGEDDDDDDDIIEEEYYLKPSSSASTGDKAIASADSFVSKKSGAGSIVFLDAMEPRARPVLHFPASASIRTATTASMSSTQSFYTIPTIQGSQTFDSECSLNSSATTEITRPRSISSATTARIKTPHRGKSFSSKFDDSVDDGQQSIRHVQTQVLQHLPALSATDGYRC